jgi:PAS domain S-box-containing protein
VEVRDSSQSHDAEIPEIAEVELQGLLRLSPDAIVVASRSGRIMDANGQLGDLFGMKREELLNARLSMLLPEELAARHERHLQRFFDAPLTRPMGQGMILSGRTRHRGDVAMEISLAPVLLRGELCAIATIRDVMERVEAFRAKERSRRHFEQLADASTEALFFTDRDGLVVERNHKAHRLFAMQRDDGSETRLEDILPDAIASEIIEALHAGEGELYGLDLELGTGAKRYFDVRVRVLHHSVGLQWSDSDAPLFVVAFQDVTSSKELAQELSRTRRLEAIGRMSASIAHDFNNLLTPILAYSRLAKDALPSDSPLQRDIEEIELAAHHAREISHGLLLFARQPAKRSHLFDLCNQLSKMRGLLETTVGPSSRVVISLPRRSIAVLADPSVLTQVISNLAANARDAMPGGGELRVGAELVQEDTPEGSGVTMVRIDVTDTGTGMDESIRARIFDPFFTTKAVAKGTGLGLATSASAIRDLGGRIEVRSTLGHGSTFSIFLPAHLDSHIEAQESPAPEPRSVEGDETILLVEDDRAIAHGTKRILEARGFRVLLAPDREQALSLLDEAQDEVALVIAGVRDECGNLHDQVSHGASKQRVPRYLLTTGFFSPPSGSPPPQVPLLWKPYTPDQLLLRVRQCLDAKS